MSLANNSNQIKKLKAKFLILRDRVFVCNKIFASLIILLFLIFTVTLFVYYGLSFKKIVAAVSPNYSKSVGQPLTASEWNNLPNDFLDKQNPAGDTMAGLLKLPLAPPTDPAHATTKQYVDNTIAAGPSSGGGSVFTYWGSANCPASTIKLYDGFVFNSYFSNSGGGTEPSCIQYGDPGPDNTGTNESLYPLGTDSLANNPPGIPDRKEIKCAVCYKAGSVCFERWGTQQCSDISGFSVLYAGYSMGGYWNYAHQINRHCVNQTGFDTSVNSASPGAVWSATTLYDNADIGVFTTGTYLQCAMCCK